MSTILLMSTMDLRDDLSFGSHEVRTWLDAGDPAEVEYIVVWGTFALDYGTLPKLKAIFSLGAGVDHLGDLSGVPDGVAVVRFVDPLLTEEMTGYVILNVLRFHREDPWYRDRQAAGEWEQVIPPAAGDVRIGIAGAGELGSAAAKALFDLGYDVAVWSRSRRSSEGMQSFIGRGALPDFLRRTKILINLLPLTEETRAIWCAETFNMLEDGAYVINAGRGASLVEADLLACLESGRIAGAALDVFEQEPLAEGHAFWTHPRVFVTPHAASLSNPVSIADHVMRNIARIERGAVPIGLVDRERGY